MSAAEEIAAALGMKRAKPGEWRCRCPVHNGSTATSLCVTEAAGGDALVYCHGQGCDAEAVLATVGLPLAAVHADYWDRPPNGRGPTVRAHGVVSGPGGVRRGDRPADRSGGEVLAPVVAEYLYREPDGTVRYRVTRHDPKDFRPWRPDGRGGWALGMGEVEPCPYRWPELAAADPAEPVFKAEGEKDADRLAAIGLVATTNSNGTGGKWTEAHVEALRGRNVVVLPDNDDPGRKHAQKVAASLVGVAASVKVVQLAGLPDRGDVSDWLDAGGTAEELRRYAATAPAWVETAANGDRPRLRFLTAREFAAQTPAATEWVAKPWIAVGSLTKIDGPPKAAGKTTFLTRMIAAVLDGADFLGEPTRRGPVILLTEQGGTSFREALAAAGLLDRDDLHLALYRDTVALSWEDVAADTFAQAREAGAVLVVVDTLPALARVRGDDENSSGRALAAIEPLQLGADALGVGLALSFHDRKGGGEVGESGRGSSAYAGAVDVVLHLERTGGNFGPAVRRLTALSRFADTPDELYVELTPAGYVSLGDRADVVRAQVAEKLADALPKTEADAVTVAGVKRKGDDGEEEEPEPGILDALAAAGVKAARSTVDAELDRWQTAGYVGRTGAGKRGDPYRYWLLAKPPNAFLRSKPSGASEERNARGETVSSDARPPSEESNDQGGAGESAGDEDDPFLSSDGWDAYSGRNESDETDGDDWGAEA